MMVMETAELSSALGTEDIVQVRLFVSGVSEPVLRIHDILVWIRIRGSMRLTNGSGSWIRILLLSSLTFKMPTKNYLIFIFIFSAYYFLKVHLHNFSKIKSQTESQENRNQGFSFFCIMIEGSGAGAGSIPLTDGSGSGRPTNMWIRWIWIRIRNTGPNLSKLSGPDPEEKLSNGPFSATCPLFRLTNSTYIVLTNRRQDQDP